MAATRIGWFQRLRYIIWFINCIYILLLFKLLINQKLVYLHQLANFILILISNIFVFLQLLGNLVYFTLFVTNAFLHQWYLLDSRSLLFLLCIKLLLFGDKLSDLLLLFSYLKLYEKREFRWKGIASWHFRFLQLLVHFINVLLVLLQNITIWSNNVFQFLVKRFWTD